MEPTHQDVFDELKVCVLLPTYNNAATLAAVIEDVQRFTHNILVVNDGATDATGDVLAKFIGLHIIQYEPNRGKGFALRTGLRAVAHAGYDYAITLDTDGQHFADDLPVFLDGIRRTPGALLVGARNMSVEHVPAKSSFGNRFSNFWFWVNTGVRLPDTQSGYRLYPVQRIGRRKYFSNKYEFEIEVLVRASWAGVPVLAVPVSVYYPPPGERVSHFRPSKDFARISVLNTVLVTIAVLWVKPRDFTRNLFNREGRQKLWRGLFQNPGESNLRKASSVGFGIFMGIVPLWGLQLLIGIPAAIAMRLNKALFLLSANVSIFPFTPFWMAASLALGKRMFGIPGWRISLADVTIERMKAEGLAFLAGGLVLSLAMGALAFLVTLLSLKLFRPERPAAAS